MESIAISEFIRIGWSQYVVVEQGHTNTYAFMPGYFFMHPKDYYAIEWVMINGTDEDKEKAKRSFAIMMEQFKPEPKSIHFGVNTTSNCDQNDLSLDKIQEAARIAFMPRQVDAGKAQDNPEPDQAPISDFE